MRVANCSPALDTILVPMGPEILSNTGAGVWRKAPGALPDSNFSSLESLDPFSPPSRHLPERSDLHFRPLSLRGLLFLTLLGQLRFDLNISLLSKSECCESQAIQDFLHRAKLHLSRRQLTPWLSKQGSTPTPWSRGLRDQIQKWALQTQKTLYF